MREPTNLPPAIDDEPTAIHMRSGGVTTPLVGGTRPPQLGQARPSRPVGSRPGPHPSSSPEISAELRAYQMPLALSGNPCIAAAAPLLDLIVELRATEAHPDVARLQSRVAEQVRAFETRLLESGTDPDHMQAARYALCSAVDEAVLTTDWGAESSWSRQSLLSQFYNDVWGGEKVFEMLEELRRTPKRTLDVIELIAILIGLGFEGRYRVMQDGAPLLEDLRRDLFRQIRRERDERPIELTNNVQIRAGRRGLRRYVPIWVVASVWALIATMSYFYFENQFDSKIKPYIERLQSVISDPLHKKSGS
jgi:type VI secretion system protein ImpK